MEIGEGNPKEYRTKKSGPFVPKRLRSNSGEKSPPDRCCTSEWKWRLEEKASKHDLRMQVLTGYMAETQITSWEKENLGVGPLHSARMIIARCFDQRLAVFLYNNELFVE